MTPAELRALSAHTSPDRFGGRIWEYDRIWVATDGPTICVRTERADWRTCDLPQLDGAPSWRHLWDKRPTKTGPGAFGLDPALVARVADVERAARAALVIDHLPGETLKAWGERKKTTRARMCAEWSWLGTDELSPLSWTLHAVTCDWHGIIMPRRM